MCLTQVTKMVTLVAKISSIRDNGGFLNFKSVTNVFLKPCLNIRKDEGKGLHQYLSEIMKSSQSLRSRVSADEEAVFTLKGTQLFRKPLKQIGNSIADLRDLYIKKGEVSFIPRTLDASLSGIKHDICCRLEDDIFQEGFFDFFQDHTKPNDYKLSDAFVVMYESLAAVLGIQNKRRLSNTICDVLIAKPNCPVLLLTVEKENNPFPESNITLARSTTNALRRFIDEDFHLVSGIVKASDLKDRNSFKMIIEGLVSNVCTLITTRSLIVKSAKYEKVLTAIFASFCETKSLLDSDVKCEYLHFLTLDQGKIIIENLDCPNVTVTSTPKAGSSNLMLEVARRLSILDKTLLIVRTKEEMHQFSSFHIDTVCLADLLTDSSVEYLSRYRHVVDETKTVKTHTPGRLWTFVKDQLTEDDLAQAKLKLKETVADESEWKEDPVKHAELSGMKHTEEDLDLQNELTYSLPESDKDVQIQALQRQIEAMKAKLYAWVKSEVKDEPESIMKSGSLQTYSEDLGRMEEIIADVKPLAIAIPGGKHPHLKAERSDVSSEIEGIVIKQEPVDVPSDDNSQVVSGTSKTADTSDSEDSGSTHKEPEYPCPLCSVNCVSRTDFKQHYEAKHLTSEGSTRPVPDVDTPEDVAVAGPSHCPDSPPVPAGSRGIKRVKVTYLECPYCPKRLKTERGCERHMDREHPGNYVPFQPAREEAVLIPNIDEYGNPFYQFDAADSPRPVSCPAMTLDTNRVNRRLHVTEDGLELENTERRGQSQGDIGGFRNYEGTCSRLPIPLPPSPSTLTTPRYWETHTRVRVERVDWPPLLEIGLCQEGEVDTDSFVSYQTRNSWAVEVGDCFTHGGGICTQVYREGKQVGECCINTMSNTPGTTAVLHYGVVLDVGRGRLAFLDLDRGIVLSIFNVQFTESLRPMFGVCDSPFDCTETMRLVSGAEITMTDTKKDLICQALSTT